MSLLTDAEIESKLVQVASWKREGDSIRREHTFDDFLAAIRAVDRIAELAEEQNHHPDILIQYNRLTLTLSTHSAGGLTARDFRLAAHIDSILT